MHDARTRGHYIRGERCYATERSYTDAWMVRVAGAMDQSKRLSLSTTVPAKRVSPQAKPHHIRGCSRLEADVPDRGSLGSGDHEEAGEATLLLQLEGGNNPEEDRDEHGCAWGGEGTMQIKMALMRRTPKRMPWLPEPRVERIASEIRRSRPVTIMAAAIKSGPAAIASAGLANPVSARPSALVVPRRAPSVEAGSVVSPKRMAMRPAMMMALTS